MEVSNWRDWVIAEWVKKRFGKEITVQTAYNILKRLGYSKTRAKRQNKKADGEAADEFRERVEELIESKDEKTIVLYEDEGIFSSEPTATSVWTKVGVQAIVKTHGETRKNAVILRGER